MFFTLFGCLGGGSQGGLLVQFSNLGSPLPSSRCLAEGNRILALKLGNFYGPKYMANDDSSRLPGHTDSKTPIFISVVEFGVQVTSGAWG